MESLAKADIFFFITTIAVIFIAVVAVIALVYVIKILRDVRYISRRARDESDKVISDVDDLRGFIRREGRRAAGISDIMKTITKFIPNTKRSRRKKKEE